MTTYLRPGTFIEETLVALADNGTSSSDAVAAFVGTSAKGGPLGPTLVTSWSQYRSLFGDIQSVNDDMGYAVFAYFNNGGAQAYIVRAVNAGATPASVVLKDGDGENSLTVTAKSPGAWAHSTDQGVYVSVTPEDDGRFDLTIEVGQGVTLMARETFVDLSLDPNDARNALSIVNSLTVGSKYVRVSGPASGVFGTDYDNPVAHAASVLTGGTDGTGSPDLSAAARTLDAVTDTNFSLNLPGVSDVVLLTDIVTWAESVGNVFVVADGPKPGPTDTPSTVATALNTLASGLPASSHVAVYGPWLYVTDPASRVSGAMRLTAPGGLVLGQYAHNDTVRGVQKAPAGTGTALKGVVAPAVRFDSATLDSLNQGGVNVIKQVPGYGFCLWGTRTLDRGMPDRYINIRRSLMMIERDLVAMTRFAVFETNDSDTWDQISAVLSQYLLLQWQSGVLSGSSSDQAFYVICDETNNDATSVNAGVVNVQVGVALNAPAEFIVIRIGQFDGGATVTEES